MATSEVYRSTSFQTAEESLYEIAISICMAISPAPVYAVATGRNHGLRITFTNYSTTSSESYALSGTTCSKFL